MEDISVAACAVLQTGKASEKATVARTVAAAWRDGKLPFTFTQTPTERPARPSTPELLPRLKCLDDAKANEANRRALLHAVAHIELNAIDLAFDIVARFGK